MDKFMTVEKLYKYCELMGFKNREIVLASDAECNSFSGLDDAIKFTVEDVYFDTKAFDNIDCIYVQEDYDRMTPNRKKDMKPVLVLIPR